MLQLGRLLVSYCFEQVDCSAIVSQSFHAFTTGAREIRKIDPAHGKVLACRDISRVPCEDLLVQSNRFLKQLRAFRDWLVRQVTEVLVSFGEIDLK